MILHKPTPPKNVYPFQKKPINPIATATRLTFNQDTLREGNPAASNGLSPPVEADGLEAAAGVEAAGIEAAEFPCATRVLMLGWLTVGLLLEATGAGAGATADDCAGAGAGDDARLELAGAGPELPEPVIVTGDTGKPSAVQPCAI